MTELVREYALKLLQKTNNLSYNGFIQQYDHILL